MIALEPAGQHLEIMGLNQAVEALDNNLNATPNEQLPHAELLEQLLGAARQRALTSGRGPVWPTVPSRAPLSSSTSLPGLPLTDSRSRDWPVRFPKKHCDRVKVPYSGSCRMHVGPKTEGHSGTNIGFRPGALPAEARNHGH